MIKDYIKNLVKDPVEEEGDYTKDGLLYCGKCNTPKQTKVMLFGTVRYPAVLCKCRQEAIRKEEKRIAAEKFADNVDRLRSECFSNEAMKRLTFDNDDGTNSELSRIARNYAEKFGEYYANGKGLLLFGTFGTGKTFASCAIANYLIDKGISVKFASASSIANEAMRDKEYFDRMNDCALLIIDDLAAERDTSYAKEQVQNLVDMRVNSGRPMIVTTNLSAKQISNPDEFGMRRTIDRIVGNCFPYEVKGESRRMKEYRDTYADMRKELLKPLKEESV